MQVTSIKTEKITPGSTSLIALLDAALPKLEEDSVVAISSKIISLCENRVVPLEQADKETLIRQESDWFLPTSFSPYGYHFTVTRNTVTAAAAGIDESNGSGHYVLWPRDAQATANQVRGHLLSRDGLHRLGVIITDSGSHLLRRGAVGIMLAWSGFAAVKNYVGTPDLFGRPFHVEHADIAGGLAAAAVLQMGEGNEQTPLAVITGIPSIEFQDRDPTPEEIANAIIPMEDDLFAPFLTSAPWQRGDRSV